jgi:uncharacterized protein (TIGR03083 family)
MAEIDVGVAYAAGRERVVGLVAGLPAARATSPVPACPDWQVKDVVAHLSGVCVDILAGRLEGAGTARWADAHAEARRDRPLDDIVAEWSEAAPRCEAMAADFGPGGRQWVFDFSNHEHDIRGALDAPGARDADTGWIALGFIVPGFLSGVVARGLAPLRVVTGSRVWDPDGVEPVETVTADPFEFGRAVSGRRSLAQIRSLDWSTDPEPYLPAFSFGPFTPRATDLVEDPIPHR